MMSTPERLAQTRPSMIVRHLVLSICKSMARTDRVHQQQNKRAGVMDAYVASRLLENNFPVSPKKFPVPLNREIGSKCLYNSDF